MIPPQKTKKEVKDDIFLCHQRQDSLEKEFSLLISLHAKYDRLIAKGKRFFKQNQPKNPFFLRVNGCQSETFLETNIKDSLIWFSGQSNSLISSGLLCILIEIYSGLSPSIILKCPPKMIERMGFHTFLSLNRANGLHQIYLHMKERAIYFLMNQDRDFSAF